MFTVASLKGYRNHVMKTTELTVMRVGKSRVLRIPAEVLRRYNIGDTVIMEQHPNEIVLRRKPRRGQKLTWAQTYQQIAEAEEHWTDWEMLPEGLASVPGDAG
jgi:antitoxin component of MazEF toxin-antitoxin module